MLTPKSDCSEKIQININRFALEFGYSCGQFHWSQLSMNEESNGQLLCSAKSHSGHNGPRNDLHSRDVSAKNHRTLEIWWKSGPEEKFSLNRLTSNRKIYNSSTPPPSDPSLWYLFHALLLLNMIKCRLSIKCTRHTQPYSVHGWICAVVDIFFCFLNHSIGLSIAWYYTIMDFAFETH